ncbi:hypothetical protein [Haliea sp. E17]|uniref:hypothetical protein n=1 Tax=Haliea sp. E17 TaxID=3401576 RepID=UPI003AABAF5C
MTKKYKAICVVVFSALTITWMLDSKSQAIETKLPQYQNIIGCLSAVQSGSRSTSIRKLAWENLVYFNSEIIGFNPSFRGGNSSKPGSFTRLSYRAYLDSFPVGALRFPPGTYANYYDWDSMTLDAHLVDESPLLSMHKSIDQQKIDNSGFLIRSDYREFLSLVKDEGIQPFIILNPYLRSIEYNQQVIETIKHIYPGRIYWEMGNEISQKQYQEISPDGNWGWVSYLYKAQRLSKYIRSKYSDDRIGFVAAEPLVPRGHINVPENITNYELGWNSYLNHSEVDFDAAIFHPYINIYDKATTLEVGNLRNNSNCHSLIDADLERMAKFKWVFSSAQHVPRQYAAYVQKYFPNKDVWISEVGLIGGKKGSVLGFGAEDPARTIFNIMYFAYWVRDVPGLRTYQVHLLANGRGLMSIMYPDSSLNSNSISFLLLNKLFYGADKFGVVELESNTAFYGSGVYSSDQIKPVVAVLSNGASRKAIVLNLSFEEVNITLPFKEAKVLQFDAETMNLTEGNYFKLEQVLQSGDITNGRLQVPSLGLTYVEEYIEAYQ